VDRRLAAILAADVVGYSRMMELDESGTLEALKTRRREILQPLVAEHHGRVVKLMGDGVLVEFASAVNAVACAVKLQAALAAANETLPEDRKIVLRIGVNLGDVIVEGSDLYGEGVNIAARLEAMAEPGGVCISGKLHDETRRKLQLSFEDLGERQLKNIARPMRAYRVLPTHPTAPAGAGAPGEQFAPLATKPSIAILPFNNMSAGPEEEYFSDGITEDLITELSRFRNLSVIARNSSFAFKGQAADIKEVGRKLGARYVVEGSVRKAGDRARITAQLIEAATGNHLWAERYDRKLEDIFAVQDEVVKAICGAIPGQIDRAAVEYLRRKAPSNPTAYDCELRGRWALTHWSEGISVALDWFEKAVEADPGYAPAHAGIALAYAYGLYVLGLPAETALARAREHAQRATALDDKDPKVSAHAAMAYMLSAEHKLSSTHAERAVSLNPNDPFSLYVQANVLTYAGKLEQALDFFARSERLEPYGPDDQRFDCLCDCHYMRKEYGKVVEIHSAYQKVPAFLYLILAAALAQLGQTEKARAAVADFERLRPPGYDCKIMIEHQVRMCWRQEDRDHWLEGYRNAGINV
jgi:TolB-like protein/Tfp pilus assembly protein PilF